MQTLSKNRFQTRQKITDMQRLHGN